MFATLSLSVALASAQDPGPGISRELAAHRAALISNVRYELTFDLVKGRDEVQGEVIVYFTLPDEFMPTNALVLDFGGHGLDQTEVNSVPIGVTRLHDHVLIAANLLNPGQNQFEAHFRSKVAATGTPLSVFKDPQRDEEFVYTLVVPADAHRLFPCFDQPDLKGVVSLRLTVPAPWIAVANAAAKYDPPDQTPEGRVRYEFEDTPPISTYLIAFAAGPFTTVSGPPAAGHAQRIFARKSKVGDLQSEAVFSMHAESVRWLERYFDQPYPFGKLDSVVIPGFPYGGMEHAGAIFYRESALVFDHTPTESELVRRSTLIYHEVSHQWFGNLVTMTWFDDLWLKEGFATFIGYQLLAALEPERNAWLRFHQDVKPAAYRVDSTPGTTPVYQELGNLADAKSAYGAIVYNKAPAVLRELHERLGARAFRDGARLFLRDYALRNATWNDLVRSLQQASGQDLARWSERWILAAGMPRVRVRWETDDIGAVASFEVLQESVQGEEGTWPLRLELLWVDASGDTRTIEVSTDRPVVAVEDVVGKPAPACVLLNPGDVAYGQFLLDSTSQEYLLRNLPAETDPLRRAVALSSLFDTVREAELAPALFAELLIELLGTERDPLTQASLLDQLSTVLGRYLHVAERERLTSKITVALLAQLRAGLPGLELQTFRFLARHSTNEAVLKLCEELLKGEPPVPGLTLGQQDRYLALAALIAADRAGAWPESMTGEATPEGAEKYAFLAEAAAGDAATKKRYFEIYAQLDEPPEQWMQQSLGYFHWPGQSELTLPYLYPALDAVDWVKTNRKIFFMPAWIDAFVNGHSDAEALRMVDTFLADHPGLSPDVRRKILQSRDGLRRAVAIKDRWQ